MVVVVIDKLFRQLTPVTVMMRSRPLGALVVLPFAEKQEGLLVFSRSSTFRSVRRGFVSAGRISLKESTTNWSRPSLQFWLIQRVNACWSMMLLLDWWIMLTMATDCSPSSHSSSPSSPPTQQPVSNDPAAPTSHLKTVYFTVGQRKEVAVFEDQTSSEEIKSEYLSMSLSLSPSH